MSSENKDGLRACRTCLRHCPPFSKDCIEDFVKKFSITEIVSTLFLLIEFHESLTPRKFLKVIENDRSCMESCLTEILFKNRTNDELLIEILGILQRNDLLQEIHYCHHEFKKLKEAKSLNNISNLWKVLYQLCESLDPIKHRKYFDNFSIEFGNDNLEKGYLEAYFAEAYERKLFSRDDLSNLKSAFDQQDFYKILNQYDENGENEFYYIKFGLVLIINHDTFSPTENNSPHLQSRESSHLDVCALEELWKNFGFEVKIYNNLKDYEVRSIFQNLAASDLSHYDIFITCYMSHGDKDIVYASNCKPIGITNFIDIMANQCTTLFNKPKLFFIQACQGTQIQQGALLPTFQLPTVHKTEFACANNPTLRSDVLKVVSSIPGYVSFCETNKKSWFIDALVRVIGTYGHKQTLSSLLIKLNKAVSNRTGEYKVEDVDLPNCRQTCFREDTLKKEIKLKKRL